MPLLQYKLNYCSECCRSFLEFDVRLIKGKRFCPHCGVRL